MESGDLDRYGLLSSLVDAASIQDILQHVHINQSCQQNVLSITEDKSKNFGIASLLPKEKFGVYVQRLTRY